MRLCGERVVAPQPQTTEEAMVFAWRAGRNRKNDSSFRSSDTPLVMRSESIIWPELPDAGTVLPVLQ